MRITKNGAARDVAMMAFLLSLLLSAPITGYLSAYHPEPTAATVAYRQGMGQLPDDLSRYDVLLAVLDCRRIGDEAIMASDSGVYTAVVFDCAGVDDGGAQWMIDTGIVAEVDGGNYDMAGEFAAVYWVAE